MNFRIRILSVGLAVCAIAPEGPLPAFAADTVPSVSGEVVPAMTLDPGMHTAPIRRIAVDASEKILVTASDDKSARLWDLPSGKLLAVLRPPVGRDQIGRLYGASIARNELIAVGGTSSDAGSSQQIYLFSLSSHAFIKAFDAGVGEIKRLEWSPDGSLLAAAYAGRPGIRVFDRQGTVLFEEAFSGDAYYVAFATKQRMAVSATDGSIHLYLVNGNRVTPEGLIRTSLNDPRGIQFSPDGKLIVVGYLSRQSKESIRLDVFDVASRQLMRSFVFSDVPQGNFMNVAWQSDGHALYAGGTGYRGKNHFIVKRISWPDGKTTDVDTGTNSVLDFVALRSGDIVFATAEPAWGQIKGSLVTTTVSAPTAQFYEASVLGINGDASTVSWRYRVDEAPVHFRLSDREVHDGVGDATRHPESSTWRLQVSEWENSFATSVNGHRVKLEPTEVSRASVVLPGNAGVALGTSRALRMLDSDGRERWVRMLATEVRAINVTENGKILVLAMLDGTISWRRVSDGALLLSLFPTRDRRWVIWTEAGYFDASAGAESLIGWLVNRSGGVQADYFPISRFRGRYFRPDVIDRTLDKGDAAEAVAVANREREEQAKAADEPVREKVKMLVAAEPIAVMLPPVITLLSPAKIESTESKVTATYQILSQSQRPLTSFSVRVNGRPYDEFTNEMPSSLSGDSTGRLTLKLPEVDSQVQIIVASESGVSTPATFSYHALPERPRVASVEKTPRLYLLAVGISRYSDSRYNLGLAAKDASDFVQTMAKQNGQFYRQVDARLLTDERAKRDDIVAGLKWLKTVTAANDIGMLYLAGHGVNDVDDTYYFLPHDFDLWHIGRTGVGDEVLRDALTEMKGKAIFFVDTCYSGKSIGILSNQDLTRIANAFSSPESGVIVFSASSGRQESLEMRDWGNGAFTKALVEGLLGRADYRREGVVTHKGLDYFVADEVKKLTSGMQTPVTTVPVGLGDFGLAKVLQ